ncbi:MAG: M56 family metallopeptidase [Pseudomonadota bacterium]|nr:M56 family metallopeptidase [Pseudomonadota bacterium]
MTAMLALHLWQSTVVLLGAWLLTLVLRRNRAEIRYWIWLCASLKFLLPFALLQWLGDCIGRSLPVPLALDSALIETGSAIFVPPLPGAPRIAAAIAPTMGMVAATLWALGSAALLLRWMSQWRAVRSSLAFAPCLPMPLPVPVRVTATQMPPGVFGVFRPVVIVPRAVLDELSRSQLQALLAHEMCHVQRRDNLTATLHKFVEVIFWFHPLVWWIGSNLLREREAACDEAVIESGHERLVYAESILHVCRLGVTANFAGIAASTGGDLRSRMTSIMSQERASPIDQPRFMLLLGVAMAIFYGPILAGVATATAREAAEARISFEALTLAPSAPGWWGDTRFDSAAGRVTLSNVSLRELISLAYPASRVNGDPELIDRIHYDIDARWQAGVAANERSVYRQLLKTILRRNSNLQLYVKDGCNSGCELSSGRLVAGRSSLTI